MLVLLYYFVKIYILNVDIFILRFFRIRSVFYELFPLAIVVKKLIIYLKMFILRNTLYINIFFIQISIQSL